MDIKYISIDDDNLLLKFNDALDNNDYIFITFGDNDYVKVPNDITFSVYDAFDCKNTPEACIVHKLINTKLIKLYNISLDDSDIRLGGLFFMRKLYYALKLNQNHSSYYFKDKNNVNSKDVLNGALDVIEYVSKYLPNIDKSIVVSDMLCDLNSMKNVVDNEDFIKLSMISIFNEISQIYSCSNILDKLKIIDNNAYNSILEMTKRA